MLTKFGLFHIKVVFLAPKVFVVAWITIIAIPAPQVMVLVAIAFDQAVDWSVFSDFDWLAAEGPYVNREPVLATAGVFQGGRQFNSVVVRNMVVAFFADSPLDGDGPI